MEIVKKYFSHISATQEAQFAALENLYRDWNGKINVISRKDIDNLYVHHVLHSLAIAKFTTFRAGTKALDVGTGGGFPGIPLAVLFPDVHFHLIDSIAKKIKVVQSIAEALDLQNVTAQQCRIEDEKSRYDFVLSRAVMPLPELVKLVRKNIDNQQCNAIPNGLICLKGGDTRKETASFAKNVIIQDLSNYFKEEFVETKKIIYLPI
ncbi:MAG: 16S rRNA (guanine(527)-N(7))-methyltransferase RsmG [Tannerella sp.]|jgi:16S rRNA (guanine527-N7)-methyltransferase|nr:16S rRNA (guanine(527)-N(7))-methyltransferase RsmG [Tannerella sp.]